MKKRIVSRSLLAVTLLAPGASAWETKDHKMIVALAIEHSPPQLAAFLRDHLAEVMQGAVDPDLRFMDTLNHTYHVEHGTRDNPDHVAYLASALVAMMRNRAPAAMVAYWFGALSHYVADIDQPLHTSDKDQNENWYHLLFEALGRGFEYRSEVLGVELEVKLGKALSGWQFPYDGQHDAIADVRSWQVANAIWANRYYDEIGRIYTQRGSFDAGRLAAIYRQCIAEAINDVIDLWAHVLGSQADLLPAATLAALPRQDEVLLLDVDRHGRVEQGGKRVTPEELALVVRQYSSARPRNREGPRASVYVEIDDRCQESVAARLEATCAACGITGFSAILVRKGTWTSRLYRAVKVHAASLVGEERRR
ncbi:MAG: zinc dependent phospholipase C family protein [Planctomycetota bacterium]